MTGGDGYKSWPLVHYSTETLTTNIIASGFHTTLVLSITMKFSTTLYTLAAIAPVAMAAQAYIPYAWAPDNALIHNKPISANDGRFYINKDTTAVPPYGENPDLWNTTIITGPTEGNRFWMGITGTGGQAIFLSKWSPFLSYAKWALGSKDVDGGWLPVYGTRALDFELGQTSDGQTKLVNTGRYGGALTTPSTNEWSACVVGDFLEVEAGKRIEYGLECYDFEMVLKVSDAPAPQYYHYWDEL